MNFEFSAEQNLLREQAVGFLSDRAPLSVARRILDGDETHASEVWQEIINLGWTATAVPESHGGFGFGHLELCVVAEELGRSLAPVPFSSSVYLATEAIASAANDIRDDWLPKLACGEVIGCVALYEVSGAPDPDRMNDCTVSDGALTGGKRWVTDGAIADMAVVTARDADTGNLGLYVVDLSAEGVQRSTIDTIDPTRNHADLQFNNVSAMPLASAIGDSTGLRRLLDRSAVLFAFEQLGGAEAALNMAREYALGRYAFGRPIAGYQAIKHKLAKMYVAVQLARSNCYYGAWALATDAPELPLAAATARVSASQAYRECSEENIQIHGGMGFTWEFDCHLYYRRAKLLSVNLGGEYDWKHRLISCIEADQAA